jgi:hypothetical protein
LFKGYAGRAPPLYVIHFVFIDHTIIIPHIMGPMGGPPVRGNIIMCRMVRVIVRVVRLMGATPRRWRMMAPSWPSLRVACHLAHGYRLSASHQ